MQIYNPKINRFPIKNNPSVNRMPNLKNHLDLEDMVGRYASIEPINCVDLKNEFKRGEI
ncbi:hypothetical protein [Methanobrevibacter sp.]|uniref:hypothetical protein n=1 Tax=Methanobrevibacter sp. TaxID=66852 RepID=UPI0026E0A081|nr:hypothetical protein [Methanobrevibacter sp.]MDO5860003.1 hypothetical protein [Methanobrevibacter sp.]